MIPILAATAWKSNAELIESARDLGYITGRVLDPTYGRGTWWKNWRPDNLVTHDIRQDGVDFRHLPHDGLFDTIAFDPPYVVLGGRKTSTVTEFNDRYGLIDAPKSWYELLEYIVAGIDGFQTHLSRGAHVLVKCMPFVSSGHFRNMPRLIANRSEALGYQQVDELVHLRHPGPQPEGRRQVHARRNYSTLLVLKKRS